MITVPANQTALTVNVSEVATGGIGTLVYTGSALQIDGDPNHTGASVDVQLNPPLGNNIALNGDGSSARPGSLINISGNNTWAGNIILQSSSTINAANTTQLTVAGTVEDKTQTTANSIPTAPPPTLTKAGLGSIDLAPLSQTLSPF